MVRLRCRELGCAGWSHHSANLVRLRVHSVYEDGYGRQTVCGNRNRLAASESFIHLDTHFKLTMRAAPCDSTPASFRTASNSDLLSVIGIKRILGSASMVAQKSNKSISLSVIATNSEWSRAVSAAAASAERVLRHTHRRRCDFHSRIEASCSPLRAACDVAITTKPAWLRRPGAFAHDASE